MRGSLRIAVAAVTVTFFAAAAVAQDHNVIYYEKVAQHGDTAVYQRTHSIYVPNAEDEPVQAGDQIIQIDSSDGGCSGDEVGCISPWSVERTREARGEIYRVQADGQIRYSGGFWTYGNDEDDDILDRILVVCGAICAPFGVFIDITPSFSNPGDEMFAIFRDLAEKVMPSESDQCDTQKVGDMDGLLDGALQNLIASFLNSAAATQMWLDSNFAPGVQMQHRLEAAGLLFPDGTFERLNIVNNGPCGGQIDYNISLHDSGAILIHTHPATRGEVLDCPQNPDSLTYGNRPSIADVNWIGARGVELGLIIDANGIVAFTPDYEGDDPSTSDEAHQNLGPDGKCGVDRF